MNLTEDIWLAQWPRGHAPTFTYGKPTFAIHVGKSGKYWLVPAVTVYPNQADHIYVTDSSDPDKTGEGFGGAWLHMPMLDGSTFILKGGWHSRAEALLRDTGIDTRNQRKTFGAVGLHRTRGSELVGILYADTSPKIGSDDRIIKIAQRIANEHNEPVFYSYLSAGGGASALIKPEGGDS